MTTRTSPQSLAVLRGLTLALLALDQARRYLVPDWPASDHAAALTSIVSQSAIPAFVFTMGVSLGRTIGRAPNARESSGRLVAGGLLLIVLELTVARGAAWFTFDYGRVAAVLEILWVLGASMVVLAGLVYLPRRDLVIASILLIVLQHVLDGAEIPGVYGPGTAPGIAGKLWIVAKTGGVFSLIGTSGPQVAVGIPLVPLVAVLSLGYAAAPLWDAPGAVRPDRVAVAGIVLVCAFVALRASGLYGDPVPWTVQPTPLGTLVAFVNVTRFPASLQCVLASLGAGALLLAAIERGLTRSGPAGRAASHLGLAEVLATFGRSPVPFYVSQVLVIHLLAIALTAASGRDVSYLFVRTPFTERPPEGHGLGLLAALACWLAALVMLYPWCRRSTPSRLRALAIGNGNRDISARQE